MHSILYAHPVYTIDISLFLFHKLINPKEEFLIDVSVTQVIDVSLEGCAKTEGKYVLALVEIHEL